MVVATWVTAIATVLLVFGVVFAVIQARAARQAIKAQVLMKLFEEWRDPKLYHRITYVHRLRDMWKQQLSQTPGQWTRLLVQAKWDEFAEEWVKR